MFSCVTHSKVDSQKTQSTAQVNAVMDGVIVALLVEQGGTVNAGDTVAIMEAMKMEHLKQLQRYGYLSNYSWRSG